VLIAATGNGYKLAGAAVIPGPHDEDEDFRPLAVERPASSSVMQTFAFSRARADEQQRTCGGSAPQ